MLFFTLAEPEEQAFFLPYYLRCRGRLYAVALDAVKDHDLAEDAVQDVFIQLCKYRATFERVPEDKRDNYLVTMVRNRCFFLREQESRLPTVPLPEDGDLQCAQYFEPDAVLARGEARALLLRAIERLPAAQREILILRHEYALSGAEIAQMLNVSVGAVYMRLHRAMQALGAIVRKEMSDDE